MFIVYNPVMRKLRHAVLSLLALAGCKSEAPRLDQLPPDSVIVTPVVREKPADSAGNIPSWKISTQGLGPLQAGMALADVRALVPKLNAPADAETSDCTYARSPSLPVGAVLMFSKGKLARVDVLSGHVQSELGGRIGDTEDQIKMLYGSAVKVTPHKYTDGHYMTILSHTDSLNRIVFETDGAKVVRFRSGRTPEVGFVEGCG